MPFAGAWVNPSFIVVSVRVLLIFYLFSFLCCVFCIVCLRPVSCVPKLLVSLDCPFLTALSVFSNVYLFPSFSIIYNLHLSTDLCKLVGLFFNFGL